MKILTDNVFRSWHLTANNYDEFLNQRLQSALAVEICKMPSDSVKMLPERGVIICCPSLLLDGLYGPPALMLGIIGVNDKTLLGHASGFDFREIKAFMRLREFLEFEQNFLDLNLDYEPTWENLDTEQRAIAAMSYLALLKPVDIILGGTSMAAAVNAANQAARFND